MLQEANRNDAILTRWAALFLLGRIAGFAVAQRRRLRTVALYPSLALSRIVAVGTFAVRPEESLRIVGMGAARPVHRVRRALCAEALFPCLALSGIVAVRTFPVRPEKTAGRIGRRSAAGLALPCLAVSSKFRKGGMEGARNSLRENLIYNPSGKHHESYKGNSENTN